MSENSCQPFGLQPKRPLTLSRGLLIFAISASPRFALSTVLAATHTCFIMLGTLSEPLARTAVAGFHAAVRRALSLQPAVSHRRRRAARPLFSRGHADRAPSRARDRRRQHHCR